MTDPAARLNSALDGRYHIERVLGEGGMATVYLARDLRHERSVALKVLRPELAAVVGAQRFLAEIKTTANLQHPNILPLFDSGAADGFLFYVMPFVAGESLGDRLDRERQIAVDEALRITREVAEALDYAHAHGVVHRDIKPANILLQAGRPVVSDFGIALALGAATAARLTETGLSLGTPHYMSPEQATGELNVGASTDTYALGCVLYEMLVGEPPYTGSTAQAILGKILAGELVSASKHRSAVPAHVDAAIRRALEKVPADRFASAGEFARALANPEFRDRGSDRPRGRRGRWLTRRDAVFLGAGVVSGVLLTFASLVVFTNVVIGPPSYALVWVDREGDETRLPIPPGQFRIPRVSPDGRRVAVSVVRERGAVDLWVFDVETGAGLRLTHNDDENGLPVWAPDGSRIYFSSTLDAPGVWGNIYSVPADGSAPPTRITDADVSQAVTGITPDGRSVVYAATFDDEWDILETPADGSGSGTALVTGPFRRGTGDISPDGRWISYRSDETGLFEVYVQPFPGPGPKVPVSIGGGNEPVWSAHGRELYYRRPDGIMIAASIIDGPQVSERVELFDTGLYVTAGSNPREYHVAPDGRFLMLRRLLGSSAGGELGDAFRQGYQEGAAAQGVVR